MSSERRPGGIGKIATVFACGAALFSDGYVNSAGGASRYILRQAYPGSYKAHYGTLFSSLVFVGVIVGQGTFGLLVDRVGRKPGMIFASIWLAIFSMISGLAYGGDNVDTLWKCLIAYRFLLGFGIGAEYPAGSVAAAENTEDEGIGKKHQQKLLVLSTNTAIDFGFVASYLVALISLKIFGEGRLEWVWRLTLGFGTVAPLIILPFRMAMKEPKLYASNSMQQIPLRAIPWGLTFKKYWPRLLGVCLAWFVYDWVAYPAGIYSSDVTPGNLSITATVGWSAVINAFYLPGTLLGACFVDLLGPKYCMIVGFLAQSIIGFAMSGAYSHLKNNTAAFAAIYGVYLSFGEFGPGNNLGVLAAKGTGPSAVRGVFYSIAAMVGKLGAFVATYLFEAIIASFANKNPALGSTGPVYIGSALCVVAAVITFFLVPNINPDFMTREDEIYREYLEAHGFDTTLMGIKPLLSPSEENIAQAERGPMLNKRGEADAIITEEK